MEAFAESIGRLENIDMKKKTYATFVASQTSGKDVQKFLKSISTKKESAQDFGADDLLGDFKGGFKGIV